MRMRDARYIIAGIAILFVPPAVRADDSDAEKKLGLKLVEHMPPIKAGEAREAFLETHFDAEVVGYSIISLKGVKREKDSCYEYSDTSVIHGPGGEVRELRTSGILDQHFQPETVTWEIVSKAPNGAQAEIKETLTVESRKVEIKRGDSSGMTNESVDRPQEGFVHMAGILFTLLPIKDGQAFKLQEFDSENKVFTWTSFRVRRNRGTEMRVSVMDEKGAAEVAYYELNQKGEIEQHGLVSTPFTFKRCTKERIEAIKQEWLKATPPRSGKKPAPSKN